MKTFGIIGYPLSHSFSYKFFKNKIKVSNIDAQYNNFPIISLNLFPDLIKNHQSLAGLNVTMPFKEKIMAYLDEISPEAEKAGAVNVVKVIRNAENIKFVGYNTDVFGFVNSLKPVLKSWHTKALILGTGGAAKAVKYGLSLLGIEYNSVSRVKKENNFDYNSLTSEIIQEHKIVINATPVGMYPDIQEFPPIPYSGFSQNHLAYDLIYNPEKTNFLIEASKYGAEIKNGMEMFVMQAEKSWKIVNDNINDFGDKEIKR
jgi:shikimate dehydrogenase